MPTLTILIALSTWTAIVLAQPRSAGAPAILETRPVAFPPYGSNPRIAQFMTTREAYERAAGERAFVMERVTYRSDGLDVFAYLYRPAEPPKDRRLPIVVYNRGSYVRDDFSYEVLAAGYPLARDGYLIVAPMLRGSGGASGHDEMGGADLHDLFNVLPVIREIPYADSERIFMYGESRGGIMCLLAAKEGFPARAAAVWGAITDLSAYLARDAGARQLTPKIWPGYPANEVEIAERRSAIRWPEKINVPMLLMNGGADPQVSSSHALELASAFEKLRKPYELKIYFGEGHITPRARADERLGDITRWFRRFDPVNGQKGAR